MKPVDEFLNHRYAILLDNSGCIPAETETDVNNGISRILIFVVNNSISTIPLLNVCCYA